MKKKNKLNFKRDDVKNFGLSFQKGNTRFYWGGGFGSMLYSESPKEIEPGTTKVIGGLIFSVYSCYKSPDSGFFRKKYKINWICPEITDIEELRQLKSQIFGE